VPGGDNVTPLFKFEVNPDRRLVVQVTSQEQEELARHAKHLREIVACNVCGVLFQRLADV
jgi:hypothetical protein